MAALYFLGFRAVALTLRAGLRSLRSPTAPTAIRMRCAPSGVYLPRSFLDGLLKDHSCNPASAGCQRTTTSSRLNRRQSHEHQRRRFVEGNGDASWIGISLAIHTHRNHRREWKVHFRKPEARNLPLACGATGICRTRLRTEGSK